MTPSQLRVYEFIQQFIRKNQYAPTLIEIAHGIGVSSKGLISRYVHALAASGLIELEEGKRRQIRLKINADPKIPLVGTIAAGVPIEAIANHDPIDVAELLTSHHGPLFALIAKGDSMIEAGIYDGDYVLCERRVVARDGEIVVALINHAEATLKRFYRNKNGTITLMPANIALKPQVYPAQLVEIQGIFRGLVRLTA